MSTTRVDPDRTVTPTTTGDERTATATRVDESMRCAANTVAAPSGLGSRARQEVVAIVEESRAALPDAERSAASDSSKPLQDALFDVAVEAGRAADA